jgi:hypothetical protein
MITNLAPVSYDEAKVRDASLNQQKHIILVPSKHTSHQRSRQERNSSNIFFGYKYESIAFPFFMFM